MQIHVARNSAQLGIFAPEDIIAGLSSGRFLASDLAWRDGMPAWTPLGDWSEFRGAGVPPSPGAAIADARGQRAGINAGKPGNAMGYQRGMQMPRGAVIGRLRHILLHDQPARGGCEGFDVFLIGADIADVGEGEGDDLILDY